MRRGVVSEGHILSAETMSGYGLRIKPTPPSSYLDVMLLSSVVSFAGLAGDDFHASTHIFLTHCHADLCVFSIDLK
jgi:hypothetical protein